MSSENVTVNKAKLVPIGQIKPYWNNPRTEKEEAAQAVAKSIQEYGFNQPLVIDPDGVIVVGHTRYRASLILGLTKVPCVVLDLPAEKLKEYRIADNSTNDLSEFDFVKLADELKELPGIDRIQEFTPFDVQGLIEATVGIGVNDISQEDFDQAVQRESAGYAGTPGKIEMYCPHCGEAIEVEAP